MLVRAFRFSFASTRTHYEVLGVGENSTAEQIKLAYHNLAKLHHPDANY